MKTKDLPQDDIQKINELANLLSDHMVQYGIALHSISKTDDVDEVCGRIMASLTHLRNCKRQLQEMLKILEEYKETTE